MRLSNTVAGALDIISKHSTAESFRYPNALRVRGVALLGARRVAEALPDLTRAAETVRHILPPLHNVGRVRSRPIRPWRWPGWDDTTRPSS